MNEDFAFVLVNCQTCGYFKGYNKPCFGGYPQRELTDCAWYWHKIPLNKKIYYRIKNFLYKIM